MPSGIKLKIYTRYGPIVNDVNKHIVFAQDLNVGEDRQISLRLFSEYCAAKLSEHGQ